MSPNDQTTNLQTTKPMRNINRIIIHCSATREGQDVGAAEIDRCHRQRGFNGIGYHYVVRLDGTVERGRSLAKAGAHCSGFNQHSIGICYVGGLASDGKTPKDTRTPAQKIALRSLVIALCDAFGIKEVKGHRDYSPDLNGDGIVEPWEWTKACPCFDVTKEL